MLLKMDGNTMEIIETKFEDWWKSIPNFLRETMEAPEKYKALARLAYYCGHTEGFNKGHNEGQLSAIQLIR